MSYYEEIGQKAACGPEPELYDSALNMRTAESEQS